MAEEAVKLLQFFYIIMKNILDLLQTLLLQN